MRINPAHPGDFQPSQKSTKTQNTPLNHRLVKTPHKLQSSTLHCPKKWGLGWGLNKCDRVLGGRCSTEVQEGQLTKSTTETTDG